jgi:hypothetical protein
MKAIFKLVSALLATMLVLAVFPTMNAGAWRYRACDQAAFIMDVTVPDGSRFAPGATFDKTWRLQNTGTCTWTTASYSLVFNTGDDFNVATSHPLTKDVPPWSYVDLTIPNMVAPSTPGYHLSYWKLSNGSGGTFGVGWGGGVPIFAKINVVTPPAVTYDFTDKADTATWTSGAGSVTFNAGATGDPNGAVLEQATPKFENGVTATNPGLLVSPNNAYNGFIQGIFGEYTVAKGDHFQTTVGCESTATSCYVAFSLKYQIGSGPIYTLWTFRERYEGLTYSANISLHRLAGKTVKFILYMSAWGSPAGDSAIWGHPVIVGTGTSGGSSGGSTDGWSTYSDSTVPFSFMYPPGSIINPSTNTITLPKVTSTVDITLEISQPAPGATAAICLSTIPGADGSYDAYKSPKDIDFNYEKSTSGSDTWIAYTAIKPASGSGSPSCVSLAFKLSSPPAGPDSDFLKKIVDTFDFK